jgi:CRISPR/Cas system-associated endonuclease Cas3-HD
MKEKIYQMYKIDDLKAEHAKTVNEYSVARNLYSKSQIPSEEMIKAMSNMSVAYRSVEEALKQLESEAQKAYTIFLGQMTVAKQNWDNEQQKLYEMIGK